MKFRNCFNEDKDMLIVFIMWLIGALMLVAVIIHGLFA